MLKVLKTSIFPIRFGQLRPTRLENRNEKGNSIEKSAREGQTSLDSRVGAAGFRELPRDCFVLTVLF